MGMRTDNIYTYIYARRLLSGPRREIHGKECLADSKRTGYYYRVALIFLFIAVQKSLV